MVHVEVEDGDPREAPAAQVLGGHRRVVEEAEAHGQRALRMVTGRSHRGEGAPAAAAGHPVGRRQGRLDRRPGRLPGPRRERVVGRVEQGVAARHGALEAPQVALVVEREHSLLGDRAAAVRAVAARTGLAAAGRGHQLAGTVRPQVVEDAGEARRLLRVVRRHRVREAARVGEDAQRGGQRAAAGSAQPAAQLAQQPLDAAGGRLAERAGNLGPRAAAEQRQLEHARAAPAAAQADQGAAAREQLLAALTGEHAVLRTAGRVPHLLGVFAGRHLAQASPPALDRALGAQLVEHHALGRAAQVGCDLVVVFAAAGR